MLADAAVQFEDRESAHDGGRGFGEGADEVVDMPWPVEELEERALLIRHAWWGCMSEVAFVEQADDIFGIEEGSRAEFDELVCAT